MHHQASMSSTEYQAYNLISPRRSDSPLAFSGCGAFGPSYNNRNPALGVLWSWPVTIVTTSALVIQPDISG